MSTRGNAEIVCESVGAGLGGPYMALFSANRSEDVQQEKKISLDIEFVQPITKPDAT